MIINWKFNENVTFRTDDFWYDLMQGNINPMSAISDPRQRCMVLAAIDILRDLSLAMNEGGLLEDM